MSTITVSILGHNEAHILSRALESVRWADEIIYVDAESTDNSLEVARAFTSKVFSRPNNPNLNVNKSYGFSQAAGDWILYLDPDETVPEDLAREIRRVVEANPAENGFSMPRRNYFFGRWVRHGGKYPDTQLRLFRRGRGRFACRDVHERLEVDGGVGRLKQPFNHHTTFTPQTPLDKMGFYTTFFAARMYREGRRPSLPLALKMVVLTPLRRFISRYFLKLGFLDGMPGLFLILVDNFEFPVRYFKLWYYTRHPETLPPEPFKTDPETTP